jgi:hypothetical protein
MPDTAQEAANDRKKNRNHKQPKQSFAHTLPIRGNLFILCDHQQSL